MITEERLDSRRLGDILGLFLAVMLLGILAGKWTTELPVKEELAGNLNISDLPEGMTEDSEIIPEVSEDCRPDKGVEILAQNRLGQMPVPLEVPEIKVSQCPEVEDTPVSAAWNMENITPQPEAIAQEPFVADREPAIIPEESEPIPDDKEAVSEKPGDALDNEGETEQSFVCNGFLCDASGKIIGCRDVSVTDGVLCLPSDTGCAGAGAGAFASLGEEVYEVYIPANIVMIDEGAFDGLTELVFIQVHPDNPVYGSTEGILFKK